MKSFSFKILLVGIVWAIFISCQPQKVHEGAIWQSAHYNIYPDRVVQQPYTANILSPKEIVSNYKSPDNEFMSPEITFKFSINGKDNEMLSGMDHQFMVVAKDGKAQTPLIQFGQHYVDTTIIPANTYLTPNTTLNIRLDMREVLSEFDKKGYYETFNGEKIHKEDFKKVFVAGSTSPLTWDFDNLYKHKALELKDPDGDGIYELTIMLNQSEAHKATPSNWKLSHDISSFPQYASDYVLVDALYNMALEEMLKDIETDSTFRTGKEWGGVWTRDISYSIILSMATLQPKVSQYSLMRKVKNGRIVQDTGTGGAYPVSTDRIVWAIAAWEIYKVTGEEDWLKQSFEIIRNSMEDDLINAYDENTGLFKGESSFLDWREQTYPEWMEPADIYASQNLGTNVVFYQASTILSQMAEILSDASAAQRYSHLAEKIKKGINEHLWMPEKGYYGQYLYGRNFKILSPRAEALGEALSVLFDVADEQKQKTIVATTPVTAFGIPCIYPQIPNIPPYHNNGIWPFVQAYWSLAAAKTRNEAAFMESLSAIYRPAALFLTNKENFVSSTGDFAGTQINSDEMLWSLSGNLGMVYKVFLGMDFKVNSLSFSPFVPEAFQGQQQLSNFKYRNAVLDIVVEGYGNEIQAFILNGKEQEYAEVPADLEGVHTIKIVLSNNKVEEQAINYLPTHFSPATPIVTSKANKITWEAQEGVEKYRVLMNGQQIITTNKTSYSITEGAVYAAYQVIAVDTQGYESFASEPVVVAAQDAESIYELEKVTAKAEYPYKGYSGEGFIEISKNHNTSIEIEVFIAEAGLYAIDFRYSNGNGSIKTDNKCAIRTLKKDELFLGTIVLPQRGAGDWSNWGFTNNVQVALEKGRHTLTLAFEPANENMNGEVNQAMLDYMRIIQIK